MVMNLTAHILPTFSHLGLWGYWLVFFIAFAESVVLIGEVIPGSTLIIFAGFLSSQGILDIGDLIWFATIGAILGDGLSYYLGTKGTNFFHNENRFLKAVHLERGERFFNKHGDKSIFLGRFLGFLRPLVPFVAGLSRMSPKRFLFWNVISALFWAVSHLLIGYFFGSAFNAIDAWATRVGYGIGILFIFLLVLYGIKVFVIRYGYRLGAFMRSVLRSIKRSIISNHEIQSLKKAHPRFFSFMAKRLERGSFTGLSLTLVALGFTYLGIAFLSAVFAVVTSGSIVAADMRIASLLNSFRSPELVEIFLWITVLGTWQIVSAIAVVSSLIFWLWKEKKYIPYLWVALGIDAFLSFVSKLIVHRARPENAVYLEPSYSFPSGHAMVSVVLYGFLAYVLIRQLGGWKRKVNIFFLSLSIVLAIGFSRLYLGVHYLSDVWGGYLLGLLILTAVTSVYEWRRFKEEKVLREEGAVAASVKVATVLLLAALALGYGVFAAHYKPRFVAAPPAPTQYLSGAVDAYFINQALPKFSETVIGTPQEPLDFIFLAKDDAVLTQSFEKASWFPADQVSVTSLMRALGALITNGEYLRAPMTPTFWNATVNDFGFEQSTPAHTLKDRHHIRIWKTNLRQGTYAVYVGTASFDQGYKWFLTHAINPDLDSERAFVLNSLESAGVVSSVQEVQFVSPTLGTNFADEPFFTDGKLYILYLQ